MDALTGQTAAKMLKEIGGRIAGMTNSIMGMNSGKSKTCQPKLEP